MALRVELWKGGVLVDGVEEWWDDVESALSAADGDYPVLTSVSPYGELVIAPDRLRDLASESRRLAADAGRAGTLLQKIADLCQRALAAPDAELRFNGD